MFAYFGDAQWQRNRLRVTECCVADADPILERGFDYRGRNYFIPKFSRDFFSSLVYDIQNVSCCGHICFT